MAATGYDVSAGDTWALNELSSAVRQGTGNARANMRAFLNGLYDGDGTLPPARGTVFIAGIGQATTDLSLYQARLQDWYEDSAFWSDLGRFASDWSQEVYGDIRHYAVPGATREARRDLLNEYLQHQSVARRRRAAVGRRGARLLPRLLQPARERGLAVRRGFRLDGCSRRADAGLRLGPDVRNALRGQQPLRLRLVAEEPGRDPDGGLQRPDRRRARPARRRDRGLRRRARGGVRRVLVHVGPRRRRRHVRLEHVRGLEAVPCRVHLTRADGVAGCTLGADDRRAADEYRDRLYGRDPGDRDALVVVADRRALDGLGRSLVVDAGASDRLRREQCELLRPRRECRLQHDHGSRCRQDIGRPGVHGCGASPHSSGLAASLRRRHACAGPRRTGERDAGRHGRRTSPSGGGCDACARPPGPPRRRRADTSDEGTRRRDPLRPLLRRRRRPARGGRDAARLRATADAARRDHARRCPSDEAPTDGHRSRLTRSHVRLQERGSAPPS